jgi:hypothetical protein
MRNKKGAAKASFLFCVLRFRLILQRIWADEKAGSGIPLHGPTSNFYFKNPTFLSPESAVTDRTS